MPTRMRHITSPYKALKILRARRIFSGYSDPRAGDSCVNFLVGFHNADQALHKGACMHFLWTGPVVNAPYPSANKQALHKEGVWRYAAPPDASRTHLFLVGIRFSDEALDELDDAPWWGRFASVPRVGLFVQTRLSKWRADRRESYRKEARNQLPICVKVTLKPSWLRLD